MSRMVPGTLKGVGASLALALLAACSSSGGNAVMSVHLVDGPAPEYSALNLHVLRVEISKDGEGWIVLGTPDRTVNLLSLTGGVEETLVDGKSIPAGSYGQMRLVLGDGNTIVTPDGEHPLKVPSGMQSGVKLAVHFDVAPNTTKDVFIDFDAHKSIFVHEAGNSTQYILRPVVRAFDKVVTGAVVGTLTDAATKAPLAGVEVLAETVDVAGATPVVARSTKTRDDGSYVLDLLPLGGGYWVVAQPRVGTDAYQPAAAGPLEITEAAPVATSDLAFSKADATGAIAGAIREPPGTGQSDEVTLLGTVPVGSASHTFVLRTTPATTAPGAETYGFDLLPPATYGLFVTRATDDGAGGYTYASGPRASASVTSGATAAADLVAP